jgi:hypothetical protein
MTTQTDSTTLDIAGIIAAFSDYDSRVIGAGITALETTLEYYEESLWPALDALRLSDDGDKAVKAEVLVDRAKGLARKAKIKWTLSPEKVAAVLSVRALHTEGRLATYSAVAANESSKAKRTESITMANYASFLRQIDKGHRNEDGAITTAGKQAKSEADARKAKLDAAVIDLGDLDVMRDVKGSDEDKLATLLSIQINLTVEIARLKAELGDKVVATVNKRVGDKRKAAAGIK